MKRRLWVFSELYYPEETSTGWFVTRIAEGLADQFDVRVICAQPTYSERHLSAPRREERAGTTIHRMWSTRFSKDNILGRILNLATFTLSACLAALLKVKAGDRLLVLTNPPTLPPLLAQIARLKRAKPALLMHDVYPDVLKATGVMSPNSLAYRLIGTVMGTTLRRFDPVIVLGRDMQQLPSLADHRASGRARIIPNWADTDDIWPVERAENPFAQEHGLVGKTVIQMSGNLGKTHDVGLLLDAAQQLEHHKDLVFLFVGYGGKSGLIADRAGDPGSNVIMLPRQPREKLRAMLACSNLTVIPFLPQMLGISVPSRMYNVMAAGVPMLAVADQASELALTISDHDAGWQARPGDLEGVVKIIKAVAADPAAARHKGANGRRAAETVFRLETIIDQFADALA